MPPARAYGTFAEFEREELRVHRNAVWSLEELADDFATSDLDLEPAEHPWEEEVDEKKRGRSRRR